MASKDRILRQKEETRKNILDAAYGIAKEEGWNGLSMRKIADRIEYTAPIIYEYFSNKEAILSELTGWGFNMLSRALEKAKATSENPREQLKAMWMAYWEFAFTDTEMYQVMFGVQINCCAGQCEAADSPYKLFTGVIADVMKKQNPTAEVVKQKYFLFFSVIHGLISINIVNHNQPLEEINKQILNDAIDGIMQTLA